MKSFMTVREIVEEWLLEHGYDGLCNEECSCTLHDLMSCGQGFSDCVPGHLKFRDDDAWVIIPEEERPE